MIDSPEILRLIENAALFRGVSNDILEPLIRKANLVTLKQGEKLLSPEKLNENVYIVISGRLSVQATPSLLDKPITILAPGECVGEMSVLVDGIVSAYVIAATLSELIVIDYASFWSLLDGSSEAARNMLNILVNRVRLGNRIMADSLLHHGIYPENDIIDNLTGLYNQHGIHTKFERLSQRCAVGKQPLCLIELEVDMAGKTMDSGGDLRADQSLRATAQTMLAFLRPDDHAARLLGKKFAVLLVNTSLVDTFATAERLRSTIGKAPILLPDGSSLTPITISAGVVEALPDEKFGNLIARAESALEQAISAGRNRVVRA